MKNIIENKSGVQNFPGCESKSNEQNTQVVRFCPWKLAIPTFQRRTIG